MTLFLLVGSVAVAVVATAGPAAAHSTSRANDEARVDVVEPAQTGLEVFVQATGLVVVRAPGRELVVLGYEGEPYLRVVGDRVEENQRAPSRTLNRTLRGTGVLPPEADATATPEWAEVADDGQASWHDHRLHRMDPASRGALAWQLDLLVDGQPVAVQGVLEPLTPPAPWPWWSLGAAVMVALAAGWARFRSRRQAIVAGGLVLETLASLVVAIGVGGPLAWGSVGAGVVASAITARSQAAWSAGMAGLLVAVLGGYELADLGYAALFVGVPDSLYRGAVVVCLSAGAALALAAFDVTRRGGFARAG
jgi:hypothetical protein